MPWGLGNSRGAPVVSAPLGTVFGDRPPRCSTLLATHSGYSIETPANTDDLKGEGSNAKLSVGDLVSDSGDGPRRGSPASAGGGHGNPGLGYSARSSRNKKRKGPGDSGEVRWTRLERDSETKPRSQATHSAR